MINLTKVWNPFDQLLKSFGFAEHHQPVAIHVSGSTNLEAGENFFGKNRRDVGVPEIQPIHPHINSGTLRR